MPQVGLFWYHNGKILELSKPWRELFVDNQNAAGFIDYPDSHYNVWGKFQNIHPELKHYEYDEVPRGRVVCKVEGLKKTFIAITPKELKNDNKFKDAVRAAFSLPPATEWETDVHYSSPADIDWGDDD